MGLLSSHVYATGTFVGASLSVRHTRVLAHSQALSCGEAKRHFLGKDFCCMLKTIFSARNKVSGETKNNWGVLPPNASTLRG